MTINARRTWWTFISNDAGLLHATLATWALYGLLVRGINGLRVEKLRHKNEAIKAINSKIGKVHGMFSDELVGTVATLASFEVSTGSVEHKTPATYSMLVEPPGRIRCRTVAYDSIEAYR